MKSFDDIPKADPLKVLQAAAEAETIQHYEGVSILRVAPDGSLVRTTAWGVVTERPNPFRVRPSPPAPVPASDASQPAPPPAARTAPE